ncbi:MAG TPA: hypothetical protein VFU35_16175 [Jatrophihabitans sp.]|nr:hypothetical protein [Jatrophihabitans sp.]
MTSSAQDAVSALQGQAIEAIKSGQAAAVEAVRTWSNAVSKGVPQGASLPEPPQRVKDAIGDPAAIVDSVYDFATQLIELNKNFVHQLLEASKPADDAK